MSHYIESYYIFWRSLKKESFEVATNISSWPVHLKKPYLSYSGFQIGIFYKCYATNIPFNSTTISFTIRNEIFPNGIRPSLMGFMVLLHYPYQVLTAFETVKNDWKNRKNEPTKPYSMLFKIKSTEVILRRKSRYSSCNENWRNDDLEVFEKSIIKNKCRAPYQTWNPEHPICDQSEKMANANFDLGDRNEYPPPCQHVEKIAYDFVEYNMEDMDTPNEFLKSSLLSTSMNNTFSIAFALMTSKFKLVTHKKAYDFQTLIGNCGGYIGLILGKFQITI